MNDVSARGQHVHHLVHRYHHLVVDCEQARLPRFQVLLLHHVASTLAAFGEKLTAGDVIITGSITPPLMIEADETELTHLLEPIGQVSVRFSRN